MNDKDYKEQKQRIRKLIKKWVHNIGLGWWHIEFDYCREAKSSSKEDWVTVMEVSCDHNYMSATVTAYLPTIKEIEGEEELEKYFLHELMHMFLSPMSTEAKSDEEEQVATRLALALQWGVKYVKNEKVAKEGKGRREDVSGKKDTGKREQMEPKRGRKNACILNRR